MLSSDLSGLHSTGVVVLAATNRVDVLDAALMRPGRFDVQLHVPLPDIASRKAILEVHTGGMPLNPNVALQVNTAHSACGNPPVTAKHIMITLAWGILLCGNGLPIRRMLHPTTLRWGSGTSDDDSHALAQTPSSYLVFTLVLPGPV